MQLIIISKHVPTGNEYASLLNDDISQTMAVSAPLSSEQVEEITRAGTFSPNWNVFDWYIDHMDEMEYVTDVPYLVPVDMN